jgi:hypothetical protein
VDLLEDEHSLEGERGRKEKERKDRPGKEMVEEN